MKKILTLAGLAATLIIGSNGAWAEGPFPNALTNGTYGGPVAGVAIPNSNTNEKEIYQAVDLLLGTSSYTNNAELASLEFTGNASTWTQSNGSVGGYAFIGLGANATNNLFLYNPATPTTLISTLPGGGFSGDTFEGDNTSSHPFPDTGLVATGSSSFGLALHSTTGNTYYSDPSLNPDKYDHMLAYNLPTLKTLWIELPNNTVEDVTLNDPFLLVFEDSSEANNNNVDCVPGANCSDLDYNDMMVLVDGIKPTGTIVPEPMTLVLFAVGLIGIITYSQRRKLIFTKKV